VKFDQTHQTQKPGLNEDFPRTQIYEERSPNKNLSLKKRSSQLIKYQSALEEGVQSRESIDVRLPSQTNLE
jgi:hypothetical protein